MHYQVQQLWDNLYIDSKGKIIPTQSPTYSKDIRYALDLNTFDK
jgi:hypothetical protein